MKEGEGIKDTLIRVGKGGVAYQNTMKAHFGGLVEKFFPPLCFFLFALYIKRYSNVKRLYSTNQMLTLGYKSISRNSPS